MSVEFLEGIESEPEVFDGEQGSDRWHEFRLAHFGASEAASMLGINKKASRNGLLLAKKTGNAKEFSRWVQENILDYGHEVEAKARVILEEELGEELYPATYSRGLLSASCDGLTMSGYTAFEHKQFNQALYDSVKAGVLPDEYLPQCHQVLIVTGAERCIFIVSDGTKNPDKRARIVIEPDPVWRKRIVYGWVQFIADLAAYAPPATAVAVVADTVVDLPAVSVQVNGQLAVVSNLEVFAVRLKEFIAGIDKDPKTDQAFANCENAIKVLERAEAALNAAEANALAQVAVIDDMRKLKTMLYESARSNRLMLQKLVTAKKESIRLEIERTATNAFTEHIAAINARLGRVKLPEQYANFAAVMRNKRTLTGLRDAVDDELARCKIAANEVAEKVERNVKLLQEHASAHTFLFVDAQALCQKEPEDLLAVIKLRIADHNAKEAAKLEAERERIRAEERARAEREQAEATEKARKEAAAKAEADLKAAVEAERQRKIAEAPPPVEQRQPPVSVETIVDGSKAKLSIGRVGEPLPAGTIHVVATTTGAIRRPTDAEIIACVAERFNVSREVAALWISEVESVAVPF